MADYRSHARGPRCRTVLGAVLLLAFLTGCSGGPAEVTFVGPPVEGVRQFYAVQPDGKQRTQLFQGIAGLGAFLDWSPNGRQAIVVKSDNGALYLADPNSGDLKACLSCDLDHATVAAFSPKGDQIAIGDRQGLSIVKADGSGSRRVTSVPAPDWLSWSPDGSQLALSAIDGQWRVFIVPITEGPYLRLPDDVTGDAFAPQWSPRGDSLAFYLLDPEGLHLMTMSPQMTELRKVADWETSLEIFDPGLAWPPQWSPDGKRIAFTSVTNRGDDDIFTVGADGSGLVNLTDSPGEDRDPAWSPDGSSIAFVSHRTDNDEIYVMRADGSNPVDVSNLPVTDEFLPAWRR